MSIAVLARRFQLEVLAQSSPEDTIRNDTDLRLALNDWAAGQLQVDMNVQGGKFVEVKINGNDKDMRIKDFKVRFETRILNAVGSFSGWITLMLPIPRPGE